MKHVIVEGGDGHFCVFCDERATDIEDEGNTIEDKCDAATEKLEAATATHYESHMALSSGPRLWEDAANSVKVKCRDDMRRALEALFS